MAAACTAQVVVSVAQAVVTKTLGFNSTCDSTAVRQ